MTEGERLREECGKGEGGEKDTFIETGQCSVS